MEIRGIEIGSVTAALSWLVVGVLLVGVLPAVGQPPAPARGEFPSYRAPRMADGHPDLNGLWQAFVTADWNLEDHEAQPGTHPEIMGAYGGEPAGQSVVEGGAIPYQAWALEKKKQNLAKRTAADVGDDQKWH